MGTVERLIDGKRELIRRAESTMAGHEEWCDWAEK